MEWAFYSLSMAENENFDRLVAGLSMDERKNLLDRLKGQSTISGELLYFGSTDDVPAADFETEYSRLPWYYRLWYYILSFFKAKPPVDIYADRQVSILGKNIDERSPGLYDYQKRMLLPAFYRHMEHLKEAARFFYTALDASVNRDKGAFFAFLGSLEMPDVHKRLQTDTDPHVIAEKDPDKPEMELRQIALTIMEDALKSISDDSRNAMYIDARSLNCLKGLSSFLFDRLMMAFTHSVSANGETCSVNVVKELLATLNNILFSLKAVPSMTLMESLFVFVLQEQAGEQKFDINQEIRSYQEKAEKFLEVIRDFNRHVPLTWIIRCASRDMSLSPREISGGEDWFVIYRDFWKKRIDFLFMDYMRDRHRKELLISFHDFLKSTNLKTLENAQSDSKPDGMPVKGAFALSFLNTFYSVVFIQSMNKILRPILIDGEFKIKDNDVEFTESYNNLIKLEDEIKKFDREISPVGEYGERYVRARQEISSLPVKRRKIQIVVDEAGDEAEKLLEQVRIACRSMLNLLNGILGRENKGKYEGLSNLAKITGKDSQVIAGLDLTYQQFQKVLKLLDDIEAMENGR